MAIILENAFTDEREEMISTALGRVPDEVNQAVGFLRRCREFVPYLQWPWRQLTGARPLPAATWRPIQRAFRFSQTHETASDRLDLVINNYEGAKRTVSCNECLISPYSGDDVATTWGHAAEGPRDPYRFEIQLGEQFFQPENSRFRSAVDVCADGLDDVGLLRVTTLVHEALHFFIGRDGHAELGHGLNPYNYEFFILEFNCRVPTAVIDEYRGASLTPATRPTGRLAGPATAGPGLQTSPLGMA